MNVLYVNIGKPEAMLLFGFLFFLFCNRLEQAPCRIGHTLRSTKAWPRLSATSFLILMRAFAAWAGPLLTARCAYRYIDGLGRGAKTDV